MAKPTSLEALDDNPYTLDDLAYSLAPRTLHHWERAKDNSTPPDPGILSGWSRNLDTVLDWTPGKSVRLRQQQRDWERRRDALWERIAGRIRHAITSPSFATKGLTLAGTMSEIPREAVRQLAIDLEQGTLATADGTVIWRAVVVQRVAAPRAPWPSRSAGATRSKRETAKAWLVARFPAGIGNTKNETLLADMQADGERTGDDTLRLMTDSTMRRALRELKGGQNPVK